ncbi:hypothetical protein [Limisalsivibrio acetivorans]|uniref:hypothetical protein n=1 Tax=Limisalsivibrio acetivorans TaxID=1304888 RepID=UPI0003B3347F|nr:hypothetical protein [Limisalsivibrio acetivorans]
MKFDFNFFRRSGDDELYGAQFQGAPSNSRLIVFITVGLLVIILLALLLVNDNNSDSTSSDACDKYINTYSQENSVVLYFDSSASMKGYLNTSSRYRNYLSNHISTFAVSNNIEIHMFNDNLSRSAVEDVLNADNYRSYSYYNAPFQDIAEKMPRSFAVVGDFVLSERENSNGLRQNMLDAIALISSKGYKFRLYMMETDFEGTAYSEMNGGGPIGQVSTNRPIFVLLGAKNIDALNTMTSTNAPFNNTLFQNSYDFFRNVNIEVKDIQVKNQSQYRRISENSKCATIQNRANLENKPLELQLSYEIPPTHYISRIQVWKSMDASFSRSERHNSMPDNSARNGTYEVSIPREAGSNYSVVYYKLNMKLESAQPRIISNWVRDVSTNNDTDSDDYNKVYRFESLVSSINRIIGEWSPYFIEVRD